MYTSSVAKKRPFQDKNTFIDNYCLFQIDYASFCLSLIWVDSVLYINCQSTWSVGTLCTLYYTYRYGVLVYMECGDALPSIIPIWTWI